MNEIPDKFFPGVRVTLNIQTAESPLPDWMMGYHDFDPERLMQSERHAMMRAYERAAPVGEVVTVVGVHHWPERTDYMVKFEDGLFAIVPPTAIEFLDVGNVILVPLERQ